MSSIKPTITAREHYDRLSELGHDGLNDPPAAREYMARWDGPVFWKALGDLKGKDLLEVGIGYGRLAKQAFKLGCRSLTGLDISLKTIAGCREYLGAFPDVELVLADICDFVRPDSFDIAYSVLTMMHVEDKPLALKNMADSLRSGGRIVLSIDNPAEEFDFGQWTVNLHPWAAERYAGELGSLGLVETELIPLIDTWTGAGGQRTETYGKTLATLVKAIKP